MSESEINELDLITIAVDKFFEDFNHIDDILKEDIYEITINRLKYLKKIKEEICLEPLQLQIKRYTGEKSWSHGFEDVLSFFIYWLRYIDIQTVKYHKGYYGEGFQIFYYFKNKEYFLLKKKKVRIAKIDKKIHEILYESDFEK